MDRDEAAALLGIGADASPDAVRVAFRDRARSLHPDRDGDGDLDELARARDLLLLPAAAPDREPATEGPPTPADRSRPTAPPPRPEARRAAPRGAARRGCMTVLLSSLLIIVVAMVIAIALFQGSTTTDPALLNPPPVECVLIDEAGLTPVSCLDEPGAQRIADRKTSGRTCPAGQDALIVGDETWCLFPPRGAD